MVIVGGLALFGEVAIRLCPLSVYFQCAVLSTSTHLDAVLEAVELHQVQCQYNALRQPNSVCALGLHSHISLLTKEY